MKCAPSRGFNDWKEKVIHGLIVMPHVRCIWLPFSCLYDRLGITLGCHFALKKVLLDDLENIHIPQIDRPMAID